MHLFLASVFALQEEHPLRIQAELETQLMYKPSQCEKTMFSQFLEPADPVRKVILYLHMNDLRISAIPF